MNIFLINSSFLARNKSNVALLVNPFVFVFNEGVHLALQCLQSVHCHYGLAGVSGVDVEVTEHIEDESVVPPVASSCQVLQSKPVFIQILVICQSIVLLVFVSYTIPLD